MENKMEKIFRVFDVKHGLFGKTETIACLSTKEQAVDKAAEIVQREMKKFKNFISNLKDIQESCKSEDVIQTYNDLCQSVKAMNLNEVYIDEIPDVTTCTEEEKKDLGWTSKYIPGAGELGWKDR